ncbi:MAG: hypothetical protein NC925_01390 [Candidatus Omnitrophica bacterium]|nr:hypothetical protein [Candidatus Omnitrophota bacterium]MCM8826896.1 hypothetical protein [Candidatus Omnitrophota bacterium]
MAYKVIYHTDIFKENLAGIPQNMKEVIKGAIETRLIPDPFVAGEPFTP